jgi:HAMP domain-containing protein
MIELKIFHKLILGSFLVFLIFFSSVFYFNFISIGAAHELINAQRIQEESYELEKCTIKLFDLTKNYVLSNEIQELEDFRSGWVSHLYELNTHLNFLKEQDIDPAHLSIIETNTKSSGEISENLIDIHNLIQTSTEESAKNRLREQEQSLLIDIEEIQKKAEESVNAILMETKGDIDEAIMNKSFIISISNVVLLVTFIISLVIIVFLSRSIINPLIKLKTVVNEVGKGRPVKININSKDEIGELAGAFEQMTKDLRQSRKELEEHNVKLKNIVKERTKELEKSKTSLEEKVKSRTKELEKAKEGLERKVDERTGELNLKVAEMERFNRLAVGRELRMIELKKRIKELESKQKT